MQGASIYRYYSLHLALTQKYLLSDICEFQKKAVSLEPEVRQTNSGQVGQAQHLKIVTVSLPI